MDPGDLLPSAIKKKKGNALSQAQYLAHFQWLADKRLT